MTRHDETMHRPYRAALIGLLIATGLAMVFALGPLAGSVKITIGVETQVGNASGLPDAWMLAAALEGVGAVALLFLLGRRPLGRLRVWCVGLIFVSLGAGIAAQGAHAIWYDELSQSLTLPWDAKLLVSFVPPVSGLATLHLIVKMVEDVISNVGMLLATREEEDSTSIEAMVLDILRGNPLANWKVVRDSTGLSESNAKRALTAARKELSRQTEALVPRSGHADGRRS
jgi:TRAP-type C4-dicarboxylate transport system permease small subunit